MFHCSDWGRTWLGVYPLVPARASACVNAAAEAVGGMPPPARNPPWLRPGTSTVVLSCGGRLSRPKLSTSTSKLRPKRVVRPERGRCHLPRVLVGEETVGERIALRCHLFIVHR